MNLDWKEALGALKDSGAIPEDNSPEIPETRTEADGMQKTPLSVITDRKGRKGKTATIIEGFTGTDRELEELAKNIKRKLGVGGSQRNGEILIQGDRKKDVIGILHLMGFKTKE